MNKKGFTLIELLATIVIIALIMLIVLPSAQRMSNENKTTLYKEYEKMMVEYAMEMNNGKNTILLSEIDGLDKVKNDCRGYIKTTTGNKKDYKAYIICGENGELYKTTGYNASEITG